MMKAKPMQKVKTFLEKTPNALLCVLGAVVFLAGFYFLTSRTPLNKIWLPTTMNNDEVLYNRQVVSVITHGGPQGYFGYQESFQNRFCTWFIWAFSLRRSSMVSALKKRFHNCCQFSSSSSVPGV